MATPAMPATPAVPGMNTTPAAPAPVEAPPVPSGARATEPARASEDFAPAAIEAPLVAEGRPISVTPSIGIAMFPGDGREVDALLQAGDTAMYRAKKLGGNRVDIESA